MRTLNQLLSLNAQGRQLSNQEIVCSVLVAVIMLIVYSAIIWALWNWVAVQAFPFLRPISILQAFGIKLLLEFLF